MAMAGWYADPLGIHEKRFFNGNVWTDRVTDREVEGRDSLGNATPPPPFTPTVSGIAPQYAGPRYGVAPQYGTHPQYVVAQQYVVVNPQHIGNGFAVAALVLGIIGVVFAASFVLAWICGLLALIFGLLGRGKATRGASLGGLATAGIVLGCVALVLGSYVFWAFHRLGNAIERSLRAPIAVVDADPTANKVRVTTCYQDPTTHAPTAMGTLVNTSGVQQAFRVTIAFKFAAVPTTAFGSGTSDTVSPGVSTSWTVRDLGVSFQPVSCKAVKANAANP